MQEEDEESLPGSGIAKMLELSGCSQGDSLNSDGEETGRLRAALEELQSQNTMLQDELTLLSNVKGELEAELERTKEEFQMEREELDFKINELQMTRESASNDRTVTADADRQDVREELQQSESHKEPEENLPEESSKSASILADRNSEDLRVHCEALTRERDSALAECQHMRDILQGVETELAEKTRDFVLQYNSMREQNASTALGLQHKLEQLEQERDKLLERLRVVTEEKNTVTDVQDLKLKLEVSAGEDQKLQSSVEEQTILVSKMKQFVEELTRQNEEILSKLQMKENQTHDLEEIVKTLTEERDKILSQLQHTEENMQVLNSKTVKEVQKVLEEKDNEALVHREQKEELQRLKKEKEDEIQQLKEEKEKMEHLKEEMDRSQKTVSVLEQTIRDLSSEKSNLHQKLDETSIVLSKAQKTTEVLGSQLAALEAQLEQEVSEKSSLESKLRSLTEKAEQALATIRALEESQAEALRNSNQNTEELQTHIVELEKERDLLRSSLEEARVTSTSEDMEKELQARIIDLEQERNMLRKNLEESVKDTEGLQKDLEDMKSVSERISEDNKKLQEHISLMTLQKEVELANMEKEREDLQNQLTEKDSRLSEMKGETDALQVRGAPGVSGLAIDLAN